MMAKEDPYNYRERANYEIAYPGVWYIPSQKKILVSHDLGIGKRWHKIPNENFIAENKKTTFKISQETNDEGRLMFKVNCSLKSAQRAF